MMIRHWALIYVEETPFCGRPRKPRPLITVFRQFLRIYLLHTVLTKTTAHSHSLLGCLSWMLSREACSKKALGSTIMGYQQQTYRLRWPSSFRQSSSTWILQHEFHTTTWYPRLVSQAKLRLFSNGVIAKVFLFSKLFTNNAFAACLTVRWYR